MRSDQWLIDLQQSDIHLHTICTAIITFFTDALFHLPMSKKECSIGGAEAGVLICVVDVVDCGIIFVVIKDEIFS